MEDINQYVRNTYVIRRKLAELRQHPDNNCFEYWVGDKYLVKIFTHRIQNQGQDPATDSIVHHAAVDVNVYDLKRDSSGILQANYIYLEKDLRFSNYEPIKYKQYGWSDGQEMPIDQFCELIKYLHIISKLHAFL
jgi:hypothetical protein